MKTIRFQLRFLLPLIVVMSVAGYFALPVMDNVTLRWFSKDLSARGLLIANALSDSINDAVLTRRYSRLKSLLERTAQDERVLAIGFCMQNGEMVQGTSSFPATLSCTDARIQAANAKSNLQLPSGPVLVDVHPFFEFATVTAAETAGNTTRGSSPAIQPTVTGYLVLLHDLSFIERRSQDTRQYLIIFFAILGFVLAMITVIIAQLSWRGWAKGVRALISGQGLFNPLQPNLEIGPFAADIRARLRDLEDDYRRSQDLDSGWTPDRLRSLLHTQLRGDEVIVVSNREPYIHERKADGSILIRRPASGLVSAIEPVMRACSGTWIAHGSGSADKDVVDMHNRVAVPIDQPGYWLKRVWLSHQEEQGYYYGFANEGMWPLCHVAHVRPVFRQSDWESYKQINQRFADAIVAEAKSENPIVLVQDYHLALLPAMVRKELPQATIITFWHIPWPNPESFGICPWRREILQGLLGSSIVGFHTRFHCKNFIDAVDRFLEARIEHEHSTITYQDKETLVENYPISIAWPTPQESGKWCSIDECRQKIITQYNLPKNVCLGIGVDRFDYTKGILERFNAVERMLEKHPDLIGRFVFLQVAAPTRSELEEYSSFQERAQRMVARINQRFQRDGYQPIHLLAMHHEQDALAVLFRAADMCVVTSLHDGMNLVAKEFIASRDDEKGALILSRFAGASRELTEALIVNPYHVEETADAIYRASMMSVAEQRERMVTLRSTVREFNVYRWAGRMLSDAGRVRLRDRVEDRVRRFQCSDDVEPGQ